MPDPITLTVPPGTELIVNGHPIPIPQEPAREAESWPRHGDEWWYCSAMGRVDSGLWFDDDEWCQGCRAIGNCFPTPEAAQRDANRVRVMRKAYALRDRIRGEWKPDWTDEQQERFHLIWNPDPEEWRIWRYRTSSSPYCFPSAAACRHFIAEMGADMATLWDIDGEGAEHE